MDPCDICPSFSGLFPIIRILIEFEIRLKYEELWFKICLTDHNEILGWIYYEQEHYKFQLNLEFDQNIVHETGAWDGKITM